MRWRYDLAPSGRYDIPWDPMEYPMGYPMGYPMYPMGYPMDIP